MKHKGNEQQTSPKNRTVTEHNRKTVDSNTEPRRKQAIKK